MSREIPELDRIGLRNFSWIFAAVIAGIFGLILPWLLKQDLPWEPWVIMAVFFVWGLAAPSTVRPFYRLWMRFGFVINAIVTRIVLGAVFYVAILPIGLFFRLRGKDTWNQKWDHGLQSYRVKSSVVSPTDMEKPF